MPYSAHRHITMRAIIIPKPGPIENAPLETAEIPVPEPGHGEIRIMVNVCGVCHTDLHIAEGDLKPVKTSVVPGHQIV